MKTSEVRTIASRVITILFCFAAASCVQQHPTIPAISGTVVDAITGAPLAGIDVTLRVLATRHERVRYEKCTTQKDGRFHFASSVALIKQEGFSPSEIEEISITANIPFIPLDRVRFPGRDEGNDWIGSADATPDGLGDPLYNIRTNPVSNMPVPGPQINNEAYFAEAVQFRKDCAQRWNVNCVRMDATQNVRVPLLPVMDDASRCKRIADPRLSEGCRQLQTYRAAFRHVETIAEVRAGKELCNSVDHASMSTTCLAELHGYIMDPRRFGKCCRPPFRMEIDSPEQALILKPIAGMKAYLPSVLGEDPFNETASYSVEYGLGAASVRVLLTPDAGEMRQAIAGMRPQPGGFVATVHMEIFDGSRVTVLDIEGDNEVVWPSSGRMVTIRFHHYLTGGVSEQDRREGTATPEQRRELILEYLRKYPVAN